jgi:hypothetical protein
MEITILNTGSTTGVAGGICPIDNVSTVNIEGCSTQGYVSGLSWASAQTLNVEFVTSSSYTAQGMVFMVEVVD